jgi:hypothetical protein
MKRAMYVPPVVLCLAVVILPSLIGQNNHGPHFPVVVASRVIQTNTAIPDTVLFTPAVTEMYRASAYIDMLVPGIDVQQCDIEAAIHWTDDIPVPPRFRRVACRLGSGGEGYLLPGVTADALLLAYQPSPVVTLVAKAETPIKFFVNFQSQYAQPHEVVYSLHIVLERL